MNYERVFLSYVVRNNLARKAIDRRIDDSLFQTNDKAVWQYIQAFFNKYRTTPTEETLHTEYPDWEVDLQPVEFDWLCDKLHERGAFNAINDCMLRVQKCQSELNPYESLKLMTSVTTRLNASARQSHDVSWKESVDQRIEAHKVVRDNGGMIGIPAYWDSFNKFSGGFGPGQFWAIVARLGTGKCVTGTTPIYNPTTGVYTCIRDIVANKSLVLDVQANGLPTVATPSAWLHTGQKECLRVTLRSGKTLEGTPEHPIMTPEGWVTLDKLSEGDFVQTLKWLPPPTNPVTDATVEEATLVAAILADGHYRVRPIKGSPNASYEALFYKDDPELIAYVQKAATAVGSELRKTRAPYGYRFTSPVDHGKKRGLIFDVLDKWGVQPLLSKYKRIPEYVFRLPNDILAKFIGVYWSCDGSVEAGGGLTCSSASEGLLLDLQHLLLRFGITSRVRHKSAKCGQKLFDAYELRAHSTCVDLFKSTIPLVGLKKPRLANLVQTNNYNIDGVPLTPTVKHEIVVAFEKLKGFSTGADTIKNFLPGKDKSLKHRFVNRSISREFIDKLERASGESITCAHEAHWDTVVAIEPIGIQDVYDLTIPETHCFVANDIVVHNTWGEVLQAYFAHISGYRVLFFSKEMAYREVFERLDAVYAKVPFQGFIRGQLTPEQDQQYYDRMEALRASQGDIWVVSEDSGQGISGMAAKIATYNPDFVIVDGLYLMTDDNHARGRVEQLMNISHGLKELAKDFNVPLLASTQLNREATDAKKKALANNVENIAWGDAVGQDADGIIEMYQSEEMRQTEPPTMDLKLLKFRQSGGGPLWSSRVIWDMVRMEFDEIEKPHDPDDDFVTPPLDEVQGILL